MIKEAIILAGGLGTRLRSVVSDVPKCMAPVAGKAFLFYIIQNLLKQRVEKFIFSLGYKSESIVEFIENNFPNISYDFSIEAEPLGTGGAILLACNKATQNEILILNGDTFFEINVDSLYKFHFKKNAICTLCLKPMNNFDRYGVVEINDENCIISFKEKQFYKHGLINGGIYLINRKELLEQNFPERFSFENLYLENSVNRYSVFGFIQDEYFIDIGIPEDFQKAQMDFTSFNLNK